jgi:hypothetical protein
VDETGIEHGGAIVDVQLAAHRVQGRPTRAEELTKDAQSNVERR